MALKANDDAATRLPASAPLEYSPVNELGVVFLFGSLARSLGFRVERIRPQFPDAVAVRAGRRVRIEFEFRSSSFRVHGHDRRGCDVLVCWEHDWPSCPESIEVVELRRHYGLGFNVWKVSVTDKFADKIARVRSTETWSVPKTAGKGDLVLFYRAKPYSFIGDLFVIVSDVTRETHPGWRKKTDFMARIRRVATLGTPLTLHDITTDTVLKNAGWVKRGMVGRACVTHSWPRLYDLIVRANPSAKASLRKYAASRLV